MDRVDEIIAAWKARGYDACTFDAFGSTLFPCHLSDEMPGLDTGILGLDRTDVRRTARFRIERAMTNGQTNFELDCPICHK